MHLQINIRHEVLHIQVTAYGYTLVNLKAEITSNNF